MILITSPLIPKVLVSVIHSTTIKYTNKICAKEEEELRKLISEKSEEALVPKVATFHKPLTIHESLQSFKRS